MDRIRNPAHKKKKMKLSLHLPEWTEEAGGGEGSEARRTEAERQQQAAHQIWEVQLAAAAASSGSTVAFLPEWAEAGGKIGNHSPLPCCCRAEDHRI